MAFPLLSDALWSIIAPLLPVAPPRPRGSRPHVANRTALTGILFVLQTGIQWEMLPLKVGCRSSITCWRRLRDWQETGVWDGVASGVAAAAARGRPDRLTRNELPVA